MFEVKKRLSEALREIPSLQTITTSWKSARVQKAVPAVVVDLRTVAAGEKLETGEVVTEIHTFDMALHTTLQGVDDDEAEDALEALMDEFVSCVKNEFGEQYKIEDWWPHNVPWGTQEALCGAFSLVIEI